ncbi:hypothetical protein [Pedobacter zeae]|uniref:Uncharacterized protein n=1 Tax=Pedobacter zeae TaxID=1737356 RepID=A0A7W6K9C2_9SPHI|nr:hypothetical protein [Pedobacter zeae]MBB4106636.1 hypothetical protein [Pedobacter zeae]GGH02872.1 hypothetical protein GCM10007422_17560 [Pedobacter zeae]
MDLFTSLVSELKAGDQFKHLDFDELYEVYEVNKSGVWYFAVNYPALRDDGTMPRNYVRVIRYTRFHEQVTIMPNKAEVLNRNFRIYGRSETYLGLNCRRCVDTYPESLSNCPVCGAELTTAVKF